MSDAPTAPPPPEHSPFFQLWGESFSQVLTQIAGAAVACAIENSAPADLLAAVETDLWIVIAASGSLRGEMSLRLPATAILRLAQMFMSEPASPQAELTAEHREAVVELLRQIAGVVSTSAKARWGELQFAAEASAAAPSWPVAENFWLRAGAPDTPAIVLEGGLSAALLAQLRAQPNAGESSARKSASPERPAESPQMAQNVSAPSSDALPVSGTLNLLMDVQLAMTLRFGSRTLLLREVLDLAPGTVVELDRKVQEPVDLLLEGKLIGRGEVVVIEGSYGLRILEVALAGAAEAGWQR